MYKHNLTSHQSNQNSETTHRKLTSNKKKIVEVFLINKIKICRYRGGVSGRLHENPDRFQRFLHRVALLSG